MTRSFTMILFLTLPLVAACSAELAGVIRQLESTDDCPRWSCGANAAEVHGLEIGDLHVDGLQAGEADFRILAVADDGLPVDLEVVDGMFEGKPPLLPTRTGAEMKGTVIVLENLADLTLHAIIIDDFGYVPSWTESVFSVPAYHVLSAHVDPLTLDVLPPYEEVCGSTLDAQGLGLFSEYYAVVVGDERYDPYTKTVSASGAGGAGWFNLGCNGTALAKMKLLGYDPEFTDTATTRATTTGERAATLKMLTAAYCPSGTSHTVTGQPLRWDNRDGSVSPASSVGAEDSLEAIFGENGALCLDVPRRESADPDIMDAIVADCGAPLPSCDAIADEWQLHGEWRTANPVAP